MLDAGCWMLDRVHHKQLALEAAVMELTFWVAR